MSKFVSLGNVIRHTLSSLIDYFMNMFIVGVNIFSLQILDEKLIIMLKTLYLLCRFPRKSRMIVSTTSVDLFSFLALISPSIGAKFNIYPEGGRKFTRMHPRRLEQYMILPFLPCVSSYFI